jgi:hypothetical protein
MCHTLRCKPQFTIYISQEDEKQAPYWPSYSLSHKHDVELQQLLEPTFSNGWIMPTVTIMAYMSNLYLQEMADRTCVLIVRQLTTWPGRTNCRVFTSKILSNCRGIWTTSQTMIESLAITKLIYVPANIAKELPQQGMDWKSGQYIHRDWPIHLVEWHDLWTTSYDPILGNICFLPFV